MGPLVFPAQASPVSLLPWPFLPLGNSQFLLTKRAPSSTASLSNQTDVLIISEPILVRTGSTGSLPASLLLRENYLPSFFAYLANSSTFLSAPVECEGRGAGEGSSPGSRVPPRWLSLGLYAARGLKTPVLKGRICVGRQHPWSWGSQVHRWVPHSSFAACAEVGEAGGPLVPATWWLGSG